MGEEGGNVRGAATGNTSFRKRVRQATLKKERVKPKIQSRFAKKEKELAARQA